MIIVYNTTIPEVSFETPGLF